MKMHDVRFIKEHEEFFGMYQLSVIDQALFRKHGWRFVVFVNGKPESVHSSRSEAERYLFEAEIER